MHTTAYHIQTTSIRRTESNHSQGLARNLLAAKECLVLFDSLLRQSLFTEVGHVVDSVNDTSGSEQHTTDDQLFDGICISTRRIEDRDAQLGHAIDLDVIGTSTASVLRK